MPRLSEDLLQFIVKPSLFESLAWDEELEEAFIEESSLSKLIGRHKGGQKLVRWLHRQHKLSNEADLQAAPFSQRLLWKEYKRNPDNFVIVSAENGVAGIRPFEKDIQDKMAAAKKKKKQYDPGGDSTLRYQIIAFTDDGEQVDPKLLQPAPKDGEEVVRDKDPTVMKARMGLHTGREMQNPDNVFNLLADQIGKLKVVWVTGAGDSGAEDEENFKPWQKGAVERDKIQKRADLKKGSTPGEVQQSLEIIFKRVRPVLKRIGDQALSQIMRSSRRAAEGGNFDAAEKLAVAGKKLNAFLVKLDTQGDIRVQAGDYPGDFSNAIIRSLEKASGSTRNEPEFKEWLDAAAKGNAMALKPVLDGLRATLVGLN